MSTIENLDTITQESHEEVICDIDNIEINDETEYFDCNGSDSPKKQEETTKSIGKLVNVRLYFSLYRSCFSHHSSFNITSYNAYIISPLTFKSANPVYCHLIH